MDNLPNILSLISSLGNDPAALGAMTELLKNLGTATPRQSPANVAPVVNFPQFTASLPQKTQSQTENRLDDAEGNSADILSTLLSALGSKQDGEQEKCHHANTEEETQGSIGKLIGGKTEAENRTRLLNALRPYLGEERRCKLDLILKFLKIAELGKLSGILNSI